MRELLAAGLLLTGSTFMLLAAVGVFRMPDLFTRMQAATKSSTLGACCALLAVAVYFWDFAIASRAGIIICFFFLTAPVAAHMIARAAYFTGVRLWEGTLTDELRDHYAASSEAPGGASAVPSQEQA